MIDEINFKRSNIKDYKKIKVKEINKVKRNNKNEQESFKKIEAFEKTHKKNPRCNLMYKDD